MGSSGPAARFPLAFERRLVAALAVSRRADKLARITTIAFQPPRIGSFFIMVSATKTHNRCTQKTGSEACPSITRGRIAKRVRADRNLIAKTATAVKSIIRPSPKSHLSSSNPDFPNVHITKNLPIVKGTNFHPRTSAGIEIQVILPIVNAPFRVYYAYNYFRLNGTITAPAGAFFLSDAVKNTLPPGVLQTQIAPELDSILFQQVQHIPAGLIEPKQTFRFTVGKTF